jgi:hypothetical protein
LTFKTVSYLHILIQPIFSTNTDMKQTRHGHEYSCIWKLSGNFMLIQCIHVPCNTLTHSTNEDLLNIKRKGDPEVLYPHSYIWYHWNPEPVCNKSHFVSLHKELEGLKKNRSKPLWPNLVTSSIKVFWKFKICAFRISDAYLAWTDDG